MKPEIKVSVKFSDKVLKSLKTEMKQDIMNAVVGSPEMRKEIKRVFQMANRRIQNIEKAGVISPAVDALNKKTDKFSKFAVGKLTNTGDDWVALKGEYAKAVTFLNQPTSTAAGAREWERGFRKMMETKVYHVNKMDDDVWDDVKWTYVNDFSTFERDRMDKMRFDSERVAQAYYQKAIQMTDRQMGKTAKQVEANLQKRIEKEANKVADKFTKQVKKDIDDVLKKLGFDW